MFVATLMEIKKYFIVKYLAEVSGYCGWGRGIGPETPIARWNTSKLAQVSAASRSPPLHTKPLAIRLLLGPKVTPNLDVSVW